MENYYDLEIDNIVEKIKRGRAKKVLLQLPEGLKPFALEIADEIEKKTNAKAIIWFGSCYGACDLPQGLESIGIDLIINFGHSNFGF